MLCIHEIAGTDPFRESCGDGLVHEQHGVLSGTSGDVALLTNLVYLLAALSI